MEILEYMDELKYTALKQQSLNHKNPTQNYPITQRTPKSSTPAHHSKFNPKLIQQPIKK